jgi:hypothetical protein
MRSARAALIVAAVAVVGGAIAAPSGLGAGDHVCGQDEAKTSTCPPGRARSCDASGALAGCFCPPGTIAASAASSAACKVDEKSKAPATSCVVPDATIGDALGAHLELGELAVPTLPSFPNVSAYDTVSSLDAQKLGAMSADDMLKLADAHQAIEGGAAYSASVSKGAALGNQVMKRDASVSREIEVRRAFVARFPDDARIASVRLALARSLLRRAAYGAGNIDIDHKNAKSILLGLVKDAPATKPARNAAFILGEDAAREKAWGLVLAYFDDAAKWSVPTSDADDHAYLAASAARVAQARFELADVAGGRTTLESAITMSAVCAPRAECVSAGAAARSVIDRAFAATSGSGRELAAVMKIGVLTRYERAFALWRLADLYATKGSGTGCAQASEESRAWASAMR